MTNISTKILSSTASLIFRRGYTSPLQNTLGVILASKAEKFKNTDDQRKVRCSFKKKCEVCNGVWG